MRKLSCLILLFFSFFCDYIDIFSTTIGLSLGFTELNPYGFVGGCLAKVIFNLASIGILLGIFRIKDREVQKGFLIFWAIYTIFYALVVLRAGINNFGIINSQVYPNAC